MDDNQKNNTQIPKSEIDPWAKIGNTINSNPGETSLESEAEAAKWKSTMAEAVAEKTTEPNEINNFDNTLKMAGNAVAPLNPILRELTEGGVDSVDSFVNAVLTCSLDKDTSPYTEIALAVGINTKEEIKEAAEESRAGKTNEIAYNHSINRPTMMPRSHENDILSVRALRDILYRVKNSEAFLAQRNNALAHGKSVFAELLLDKPIRDLPTLLSTIGDQEREYLKSKAQPNLTTPENKTATEENNQTENNPEEKPSEEKESAEIIEASFGKSLPSEEQKAA